MRLATTLALAALLVPGAAFAQTPPDAKPVESARPETAPSAPAPEAPPAAEAAKPDLAAPPSGDKVGVPSNVWVARITGPWEADGARGFTRVIGTFEGRKQKLTVQWLAEPDGRVVGSKVLDGDNAADLVFGDVRVTQEDSGGVTIFVDTVPEKGGVPDSWVLELGGPGDAQFGPASN